MFYLPELIPQWLRKLWNPSTSHSNDSDPSILSEENPETTPANQPLPVQPEPSPDPPIHHPRKKGRHPYPRANRESNSRTHHRAIDFHRLDPVIIPPNSAVDDYDLMCGKMQALIWLHDLRPTLEQLKQTFTTLAQMKKFLSSTGPEQTIAKLFPIYVTLSPECPVLYRQFLPILHGITAMLPRDNVRFNYITKKGRKKVRLVFRSRSAQTLWYAQLFDLIECATNIRLADTLETIPEPGLERESSPEKAPEISSLPDPPAVPITRTAPSFPFPSGEKVMIEA